MKQKRIIIITAPSGAGKTSITRFLLKKFPVLGFSVSATTRQPRKDEVSGVDYYFITTEEFRNIIQENNFVEWEMVYEGKYYGTLKSEIEKIWNENKIPVLDIDVKGAIHVKQQFPESCLCMFIEPPSIEELKKRLEIRGTENMEALETRLNKATYEMSFKHQFDVIIVNGDLDKACEDATKVVENFLGS